MMNLYYSPRLMLKQCPDMGAVAKYANQNGWLQTINHSSEDLHALASLETVWSAGTALNVHYVENNFTGYCHLLVSGEQPHQTRSLAGRLLQDLNIYTFDELVQAVDESDTVPMLGARLVLLIMGARVFDQLSGGPTVDVQVLTRMARGFLHPDEDLRELLVWATLLTPCSTFRSLLENVRDQDSSPKIRDKARRMLASYDAAGIEQFCP